MNQNMLASLSNEILCQIISRLPSHSDLKNLRLTSKSFSSCAEGVLFASMSIYICSNSYSVHNYMTFSEQFLQALAQRSTTLGRHVKSLRLGMSKCLCALRPANRLEKLIRKMRPAFSSFSSNERASQYRRGMAMLLKVSKCLPSLREIRLQTFPRDRDARQIEEVLRNLINGGSVTRITLLGPMSGNIPWGPSFTGFSQIESLLLHGVLDANILHSLGVPLSRLITLNLDNLYPSCHMPGGGFYHVHCCVSNLFPSLDRGDEEPPRLQNLALNNYVFPPDALGNIVPYLSNIRRLSFQRMSIPDCFWDYLRTASIHCEAVSLTHVAVSNAFIQYTLSYSGLRDIDIMSFGPSPYDTAKMDVDQFWVDVISRHAATLRRIRVVGRVWRIPNIGIRILSRCGHLQFLQLCLREKQLMDGKSCVDVLHENLVDNVWPRLHYIWLINWKGYDGCRYRIYKMGRTNDYGRFVSNEPPDFDIFALERASWD